MSWFGWLYRLRWLIAGLTPGEREVLRAPPKPDLPDPELFRAADVRRQVRAPVILLLEGEETVHTARLADADLVVRRHGNGNFSVEKNRWGADVQHAPWDGLPDYVKRAVKP